MIALHLFNNKKGNVQCKNMRTHAAKLVYVISIFESYLRSSLGLTSQTAMQEAISSFPCYPQGLSAARWSGWFDGLSATCSGHLHGLSQVWSQLEESKVRRGWVSDARWICSLACWQNRPATVVIVYKINSFRREPNVSKKLCMNVEQYICHYYHCKWTGTIESMYRCRLVNSQLQLTRQQHEPESM